MKKSLIYLGLTIGLFIIGFLLWRSYESFMISFLNKKLYTTSMHSSFKSNLLFAVSIGGIPFMYYFIERMYKIKFFYQGLICVGIILFFGFVFQLIRIFIINLKPILYFGDGISIGDSIDYKTLNLGYYQIAGFVVGLIFCISILKKRYSKNETGYTS